MSRSYKKTPCAVCGYNPGKEMKKIANRLIRKNKLLNSESVKSKSFYRKLFESWRIHEFKSICSLSSFIASRIRYNRMIKKKQESFKEIIGDWKKSYYRK